ncbi:hypothetical protein NBRC116188_03530 [Oceaniserpentilla sp. 4NH20-0058]|uniref:hypothetical protein n=1 Tax=Oceaniserpentilla sp. 4NH20-0058 TaxID=3127660 RepID=UPI003107485C
MSRVKKSRSLKRVTGGVKTGTKERTKLERKQRKAKQKAANPVNKNRQRSVYQKFLDDNNLVETQHVAKPVKATESVATVNTPDVMDSHYEKPKKDTSLWDQLENPQNPDTF